MKRFFLLLAGGLFAASMALAQNQDAPSTNSATDNAAQDRSAQATTPSANAQAVIRGCLSGSSGNYTVTDQNGMQYQITGDDATLRSMVGREVEITGIENQANGASGQGEQTNGVQASEVRAVSSSCKKAGSGAAPTPDNTGMPDDNGVNPKGTPDSAEPPKAMLQ